MAIIKSYRYDIYSTANVYLGSLQNVVSDFSYNQTLSTTGAQLVIKIGQNADTAQLGVEGLTTEDGSPLTDESSNPLTTERVIEPVGSSSSKNLIQNNNKIVVTEISKYYPNGLVVFSGYISKWKAIYSTTTSIEITCLSLGQDLSNILLSTGDTSVVTQTTDDGSSYNVIFADKGTTNIGVGQNFVAPSTFLFTGVSVEYTSNAEGYAYLTIYSGTAANSTILSGPLASSFGTKLPAAAGKTVAKINLSVPITLTSGQPYYFVVYWNTNSSGGAIYTDNANFYKTTANPYASGDCFNVKSAATYNYVETVSTGNDLYFNVWKQGGSTTAAYSATDTSVILAQTIEYYNAAGGTVTTPKLSLTDYVQSLYSDTTLPYSTWGNAYSQVFTPAKDMTINIVTFQASNIVGFHPAVNIVRGDPTLDTANVTGGTYTYTFGGSNTIIATSNTTKQVGSTLVRTAFTFNTPVNLKAGVKYYLHSNSSIVAQWVFDKWGAATTGEVPSDTQVGRLYLSTPPINNTNADPALNSAYPYMYFTLSYASPLPTTLKDGYAFTKSYPTYTFQLQTVLSAIQKLADLSPANWYWYVDPATNVLNFSASNTVADITLVRGRHINTLEIVATKENIKNVVYFTGGDDGTGTQKNVFTLDTAALGTNRYGLTLLNDARVNASLLTDKATAVATAHTLAQAYLANNANETYQTDVTIQDGTIDVNLFKLGKIVAIAGYGGYVDNLLLQIVGLTRYPDQVTLQLGTLPVQTSRTVQSIQDSLISTQSQNNPSTPS